jgi:homoserine kinase type II
VPALTSLGPGELAAIDAAFGLGVRACRPLWAGTINSNFELESAAGRIFLRVNEGKTLDEVAYEAELLAHLAAHGVPSPLPMAARDGRRFGEVAGKLVTLFPWVAGAHAEPPSPAQARALGAALARLHLAGADFPRRRESRYTRARIQERAGALAARADLPPPLAPVVARLCAALRALPRAEVPRGVIHGDLFPDNVLWDGERPTLLDFEQASDGDLVYDLAVCLLSWCWDGDLVRETAAAMVAGYRSTRRLEPSEEAGLFDACRFAALRFTVTRLTDVELDPRVGDELRRVKDWRDFERRSARLEELGPEGLRSLVG